MQRSEPQDDRGASQDRDLAVGQCLAPKWVEGWVYPHAGGDGRIGGVVELERPGVVAALGELDEEPGAVGDDGMPDEQVGAVCEDNGGPSRAFEDADRTCTLERAVVEEGGPAVVEARDRDGQA